MVLWLVPTNLSIHAKNKPMREGYGVIETGVVSVGSYEGHSVCWCSGSLRGIIL